jgi:NAD(P)-dependent dehydrogenase (short-subunit alcohol dehydrogenase family)
MTDLTGKWTMITGASRGVGAHVAQALARLGSNLVLHSRSTSHNDSLAAQAEALGVKVITLAGELSDPDQVTALLQAAQKAAPIDILYNNAALMAPRRDDPWAIPPQDFRLSFEVNTISLMRLCHALVPGMLARKWGRVVNLTSGIQNQPELTAYAVSKAAVDKFTCDFAPRLKGSGVQMNLLDPGWLRTDLGGPNAPGDPASVIPGALVPALLDDGISGRFFNAQHYAGLTLDAAMQKART